MSSKEIFVAGHNGMVGSSLVKKLKRLGHDPVVAEREQLDLTQLDQVQQFFKNYDIGQVYLAAAKVGGIAANKSYPADFIYDNLLIQSNIIKTAHDNDVQKLLFLGSSCIYPKFAQQPIVETELLSGHLEPTNEPYAIAKIAGIKLCESFNRQYDRDYRSVMPTNLYGPNDNFHPENSHVIPALIRRIHEAKIDKLAEVKIWGTGNPQREFLYVDDMADACIHVMTLDQNRLNTVIDPMNSHINVGTGHDCTIRHLAETICKVVGFQGELVFDTTKPDGTPRKLLDVNKLSALGWDAKMGLEEGLMQTYDWFQTNLGTFRR